MNRSTKRWLIWLLTTAGAFLLLELPEAFDGEPGGTLSELVYALDYWAFAAVIGGILTLAYHFYDGWKERREDDGT